MEYKIDLTGGSQEPNIKNMAKIQKEGIDLAHNVLQCKDYVMIADDVGLGKTYEGLGIVYEKLYELQKENKFGKILIVAPNSNVANKWIREIKDFENNCLKEEKNLNVVIKTDYIEKPLELIELSKKENDNKNILAIIRSNKFSYIDDKSQEEEAKNKFQQYLYNENLKLCKFDLVIIDESQNLRLKESKKVKYFNAFFGLNRLEKKDNKVENKFRKTVFLTATPNHGKKEDIAGQIEFVKNPIDLNKIKILDKKCNINPEEDIDLYIIRRTRHFNDKSKYYYRNFSAQVTSDMTFLEKLTMSAIQKKQIQNSRVIKMGYLDGFEGFLRNKKYINENIEDEQEANEEEVNLNNKEMGALNTAADTKEKIDTYKIQGLYKDLNEYIENSNITIKLNDILSHPKVRKIKEILENNYNSENSRNNIDKELIFVRRRSSIDEIKKVYYNIFDKQITKMVKELLNIKGNDNTDEIINIVEKKYSNIKSDNPLENESEIQNYDETEYSDDIENSKWIEQLKRKSNSEEQNILYIAKRDFSNYYSFDNLWEENIFSLLGLKLQRIKVTKSNELCFFYKKNNNIGNVIITEKELKDFIARKNVAISKSGNSYVLKRLDWKRVINLSILEYLQKNNVIETYVKEEYEELYFSNEKEIQEKKNNVEKINISFNTLKKYYSLKNESFWDLDELIINLPKFSNCKEIKKGEFLKRELKKEIIKSNMLNGEGIIYLICTTLLLDANKITYRNIFEQIQKDKLNKESNLKKRIMNRIIKFLKNYEIESKMLGYKNLDIKSQEFLNIKKARKYYYSPIAGCSSIDKNKENAQKFFNTSFYPDILVATDILKEGIDLQLFCSRVIHYGIAWLPGDMEQRIGRIDRYFCKTYRDIIEENIERKIEIIFIYMDDPMDKKQVFKIIYNMIKAIKELQSDSYSDNLIDKYCYLDEEMDRIDEIVKKINNLMKDLEYDS